MVLLCKDLKISSTLMVSLNTQGMKTHGCRNNGCLEGWNNECLAGFHWETDANTDNQSNSWLHVADLALLIRHKQDLFRLWNSRLCWQTNVENKSEGKDVLVCYPPIGSSREWMTNQLTISKLQHKDPVAEGNWAGVEPQYSTGTPKPAQNRLPRGKYKPAGLTASQPGVTCACSELHL